MESPDSDKFSPFVFNNIMEDTFIFTPRVFLASVCHHVINVFNFLNLAIPVRRR